MAKKRKKYNTKKKKQGYAKEIVGIILISISLIGLFTDQKAGSLISGISIYLVGKAYFLLLGLVFVSGLYLIVQRKLPKYFQKKHIGIYLLILTGLALLHHNFAPFDTETIFSAPEEHFRAALSLDYISFASITDGGIIGAFIIYILKQTFGIDGLNIILASLTAIGIILTFNLSLRDIIVSIYKAIVRTFYFIKDLFLEEESDEKVEKIKKDKKGKSEEINETVKALEELSKEEETESKKVVSNIDELIKINDNTDVIKSEKKEPIKRVTSNGYELPSMDLLDDVKKSKNKEAAETIKTNVKKLEKVMLDFEIVAKVVEIHIGPSVTQYEMELKAGTKVNKVLSIHREIALALAAKDIRIQAPIPNKNTIGVEIPNKVTTFVGLKEMLETIPENDERKLLTVLGKNIMGRPIKTVISEMPHLLVAGATGSGKSVCINSIIMSILMRATPDEVKLVLIDPKKVEMSIYEGIPHLMSPVVVKPKKASGVLQRIVSEMENRYEMFNQSKTKNFKTYNEYIKKRNRGIPLSEQEKPLPYIVVIIDELADLMMVAQKEVENSIMRITQMARAAGIHLIVATQRPSTDVLTGLIKANIPSRIAFAVSSSIDSRTILDSMGAEKLLGKGDMLFMPMGESDAQRIQGAYVSDDEIKRVVDFVCTQREVEYDEKIVATKEPENDNKTGDEDEIYGEVVEFIVRSGKASTSLIQRKFSVGFNRAARIMEQLEERGIVGPQRGSKPREVLVKLEEE